MELITILLRLWRGRWLVLLSALVAIAVGVVVSYKVSFTSSPHLQTRQYTVALGTVNVLVDTPESQVIDLDPKGADAVGPRATLLANLIATTPIKDAIAKQLNMSPRELTVLAPQSTSVLAPSAAQTQAAGRGRDAKVISIRTDETLPVISIDTQAPDADTASRLANGAAIGLQQYLTTVSATQRVPQKRQLKLRQLGDAQVGITARGPRRIFGAFAAFFILLLACSAIVLVPGVVRAVRMANLEEQEKDRISRGGGPTGPAGASGATDDELAPDDDDGAEITVIPPESPWRALA
jgi:hypothetical protein